MTGGEAVTSCRSRFALMLAIAWLGMLVAQPALAQQRESPTADHLWREYPLGSDAEAEPQATVARPRPASVSERKQPDESSDGPGGLAAAAGGALLLLAFGAALTVRRGWRRQSKAPPPEPADAGRPAEEAPRAAPVLPERRPLPPEPARPWIAEIEWRHTGASPHFVVVASSSDRAKPVTVARSRAVDWPPEDEKAVEALGEAVRDLEASLLAVGWQQIERGEAWYAKRFTWTPRPPADTRSGRFARRPTPASASRSTEA